jgi:uncharacterized protein YneF (UPF0154 family)
MKKWQGYWCYIPIVICLLIGYLLGGYLTFGTHYLNALPQIHSQSARLILMLFGMGVLGATTYSSRYWASDIDEAVYENDKFLPHFFDFIGYASMIIEGGVTGVVLYLLIKTGISIGVRASDTVELNLAASLLISYCGGLFHFLIVNRLSIFIKQLLK